VTAVVHNEDCVPGMASRLEEGSVDLTVTSIPFADLFTYSHKTEDMGNCGAAGVDFVGSQFGLHLRFFCEQLFRVTRPGTNACVHVQQLVATKVEHGFIGRRAFKDDTRKLFEAAGFEWKAEFVIPKNPQAIAQRQKLHSLLFITGARDARQLAPAVNDYVLVFQRPGEAAPVRALRTDKNPGGWVTTDEWIAWASGVWSDIRETDVLDGWQYGREEDDEKHVCPLQLEVIRRCVRLYSNASELVLDPFAGIGSTGHVALEQGRRFVGFELNESYHRLAVRNVAKALHGETAAGQLALAPEAA
jgi:DNA modification methylase